MAKLSDLNFDGDVNQTATTNLTPNESLDSLLDENFYNTARSYYAYREKDDSFLTMPHEDVLDYFYEDRSWRNNNTVSMSADLLNVQNETNAKRLKEFALIQTTYDTLPSFWDDPNRSFGEWLKDNGGAMLADPVNLIGVGIGGQAAKQAYKQSLKQVLKGKIAKNINEEIIEETAKTATTQAMGKAVKKAALIEGGIGAGASLVHDGILQQTAIKSGIQDEFSSKRSAMSGAIGFGFGTLFGGGFSAGAFKLKIRNQKNTSVKQLSDLHNYGRDEISGRRLFDDLSVKKDNPSLYKNMTDEEINSIAKRFSPRGKNTDEQIKNLRKATGKGKPSDELFNYDKFNGENGHIDIAKYIQFRANELQKEGVINTDVVSMEQMREAAERIGADPLKLMELARSKAKGDRELYGTIIAHGDLIAQEADIIVQLSRKIKLDRDNLSAKDINKLRNERAAHEKVIVDLIPIQKQLTQNYARATTAGRVNKDKTRAAQLILQPEKADMAKLKEGDPDAFYDALADLTDDNHVILALQNAKNVNKWDLAAEYVNNNLLSSPDTHILNIISGLTQTQWKPFVMLLRAANMGVRQQEGAARTAREALETYVYTLTSIKTALQRSLKSIAAGRPLLDSQQMKVDNNIRQGQLQAFVQEMGKTFTEPMGVVGTAIQKGVVNPVAFGVSIPLRVLSAGDELLKQMMFRGRMTAQINSRIYEGTSNTKQLLDKLDVFSDSTAYKKRFKELEAEYVNEHGAALDKIKDTKNLDELYNDPLHYAREGSYTNPANSVDPATGESQGGITGAILDFTHRHKWLRVAGLHFINTPSNLLRWTMQHTPLAGRYQLQMRHMLRKGKDGKYLNPEAAMEAQARLNTGWLIWAAAFGAVMTGKITHGGSRDYRENRERENTTGWQPYSYKKDDGTYVNLNRLDPIMMPFFIMADLMHAIDMWEQTGEGMPQEVENQWTEAALGVVQSLVRNLTSKFYTTNILETADAFLSGGMAMSRDPARAGAREIAKIGYKAVPLSGGLRYANRIQDPLQREIFTLTDRLNRLNPTGNNTSIMPRRNMFGEVVKKQNGWMFGLGGEDGIISSPFAQTKLSKDAVRMFLKDRTTFDYNAPNKKEPKTKIDLRTIKDENGQTAYDYMLEQKQNAEFSYKGKKLKLIDYLNTIVADKRSQFYKDLPDGLNSMGKDVRQDFILQIINYAEKYAYYKMWEKYPVFEKTFEENNKFDADIFKKNKELFNRQKKEYIDDAPKRSSFLESIL